MFSQKPLGRLPLDWELVEGQLVVTESGADAVRRGDIVQQVDGRAAKELLGEWQQLVSAATDGWREVRALEEMQAAAPGSTRALQLLHADGSTDIVRITTVSPEWTSTRASRPGAFTELEPGVYYVDLTRITEEQLKPNWERLAAATAYVFDLRGYPTAPAVTVLQHLLDRNAPSDQFRVPVYREPAQRHVTFQDVSWNVQPLQPRLAGRAVFLTDAHAISYGESLMGMVEGSRLGIIVGSRTAGTNGNIVSMVLPTGHQIMWTAMQVLKRNGSVLHGTGIAPDIAVKPTLADLRSGIDTVLEAGRKALDPGR